MNLTDENYYSDREWLSNSRFKAFLDCEAKALAIENGNWSDQRDDTPLLVGNYVHSYFESEEAHKKFKEEHGSKMISSRGVTKGELKKEYQCAQKMIDTLKSDEKFNILYHGNPGDDVRKEMIITGEIEGVKVKGKIDSINLTQGYFVDLKTMKSIFNLEWSNDLRKKVPAAVSNIIGFKYHMQMGLYQELLKQMTGQVFKPVIVAVSKEQVPDKEIIGLSQSFLDDGLQIFIENVETIYKVISGKSVPKQCGLCDYCRSKKKLYRIIDLEDLIDGIF